MESSRIPIPDMTESVCHKYKQAYRRIDSNRQRPPKLQPRHWHDSNFNRSHSSGHASAHAISFRENGELNTQSDDQLLSASYDRTVSETYFEQCFTNLGKIGEGSFGNVYKVRSNEDERLYAVKVSKQLFRSESYRQERLEEVRRYEQFSGNENCVSFYRAWEQDDRLHMQMELCRESLEQYMARKQYIPEEKIWSILLDLLLALKGLHDRNLIHLDIKLDNVLIGDDDSCKLADFGLVIDVDKANANEATEGDSRYMAPEIMEGKFSKAADVFSLGIAMLELACYLELPANGPLWHQLRSGILPEDFIKSISPELQNVMKLMLTPEAQLRPTVDELLRHKKLVSLMQTRNRWKLLRKFQKAIRHSRRLVWAKLCNFKTIFLSFITYLLAALKLHPKSNIPNDKDKKKTDTPTRPSLTIPTINIASPLSVDRRKRLSIDYPIYESCFKPMQQSTPGSFNKIVNTTPVNHNQYSFRSRKDLTKTGFQSFQPTVESSPINVNSSFLFLEDIENNSHSLRKKLFSDTDDSDY